MVHLATVREPRPILRTSAAAAAVLALTASTALAQLSDPPPVEVPRWRQLGPLVGAGPDAWWFLECGSDPDRVYTASSAGLLISYDRGLTWARRSGYLPDYGFWTSLTASPNDADLLLGSEFDKGVVRSTDGGVSWSAPSVPPTGTFVRDVVFAEGCGIAYASAGDAVWRSHDEGETFIEILPDLDLAGGFAGFLALDAADEDHLYVQVTNLGLFETQDGGFHWSQKPTPEIGALSFAIDPADGQRLLLGRSQLHMSEDGGATWNDISPPSGALVDAVAFDPLDRQRLYAGLRGIGFAISDDLGVTWNVSNDPGLDALGGFPRQIAPSTLHAGQLLVGAQGGIFRSTDSGSTFERRNDGLDAYAAVYAIEVSPFDPDHLVAKTGGSMFYTRDGGQSWTESTGVHRFWGFDVAADAVVPDRFYAGHGSGGMWRSDDGGHSFYESATTTPWVAKIAVHPTVAGRVFVTGSKLRRSDDGGLTFTNVGPGGWSWGVEISSVDPDVMYFARSGDFQYSHDGGMTWTVASVPPPVNREIRADPVVALRAYAVGDAGGLWRTDDGGDTWAQTAAPGLEDAQTVVFSATAPNTLVIGDFRTPTAYVSLDGGATIREFPVGPATPIWDFAASSAGVFAGTIGSGVYVWR